MRAGNIECFEQNAEIMEHWTLLLKYFNNRSMMAHKYKAFTPSELDAIRDLDLSSVFTASEKL